VQYPEVGAHPLYSIFNEQPVSLLPQSQDRPTFSSGGILKTQKTAN
jgi:hypothetical protein